MSGSTEEDEIIRRVLAGSKDDFSRLVLSYQDQVYAMIMRQVGDPDTARELAQETFLRAYRHLAAFERRSSFGTWLIRIALNRTTSYFSSREFRERTKTVSMEGNDNIAEFPEEPMASAAEERIARIRSHVGSLPERFREVIVLCSFERKSYQEAAAILGIPVGTVSSRLNRGLCLLREALRGTS